MKKLYICLAICSALPLCAATAFAQAGSNYVSADAGVVLLMDADLNNPGTGFSSEAEFDNGWGVGAAFGHDFGVARAELEITYRTNDFDKINLKSPIVAASTSASGDMSSVAFMVNGYYDFKNSSSVTPFLMGGIGAASININDMVATFPASRITGNDHDMVFAYQVGAGVAFKTSDIITLDLAYRYFATSDPDFSGTESEYGSHNITFGIRFCL